MSYGTTHSVQPYEIVIGAGNYTSYINPTLDLGNGYWETKKCGTIPRPMEWASPHVRDYKDVSIPNLIPEGEWADRIKELVAEQAQLSDICKRNGYQMLDQNGRGYCWAHSGTGAVQAIRARMNLPSVGLSAYHPACIIKQYRDEGGWGAQGLDFLSEKGVASEAFWPQRSVSRSNDKPEMWANALLHKVTGGWVDTARAQYDRNLSRAQVATLLLNKIPVIGDYNWWGHSVCLLDLVLLPSGKFGVRIANSWGTSWSDGGYGVLDETKAWPDGATAPYEIMASAA